MGAEHSDRHSEHVPYGLTGAKDRVKQATEVLSHHKPVNFGSQPQYLRMPETSDFPNPCFLIIIPDSLSIMSREIFISNMHNLYEVSYI